MQLLNRSAIGRSATRRLDRSVGSAKGVIRLQHLLVWVTEGASWRVRLRKVTRLPG